MTQHPQLLLKGGTFVSRRPYQAADSQVEPCHDCGVFYGMPHKDNCDMERCPSCGLQLISCGCLVSYSVAPPTGCEGFLL